MLRAQKNDWRLALCMTAVVTGFSVFTDRIDIPLYTIAASCISVGICALFKTPKPYQSQERESPVIWYKREKFRIVLFSVYFFLMFSYLGFSSRGLIPAQYHAVLSVLLIVMSFFPFSTIFFALVYIRSSFSKVE